MKLHEPTNRRGFLMLSALGATGAILAACAPTAPATPTPAPAKATEPPKPATTTGPTPAPAAKAGPAGASKRLRLEARAGTEDEMFGKILPPFEQKFGVTVTLEEVPGGEYVQKMQTLAAGGTLGDVMWAIGGTSFEIFLWNGVLRVIDDYVKKENFDLNQYYRHSVDACRLDGKLGGLPFKASPSRVGLFYNQTLFESTGLKVPNLDSTWDEVVEAAKKLTKGSGSEQTYGFSHNWHEMGYYIAICRNWGTDVFREEGRKNNLDSPAAAAAFTWHYDLAHVHKAYLSPLQTTPAVTDVFVSGKLGMFRHNIGIGAGFRRITAFKWNMTLAPKGPTGKRGATAMTDMEAITTQSKEPDLSWELLKAITSKEAGIALASQSGNRSSTPGGRPDVYNSPEFLALPNPPGVQELTVKAMAEFDPFERPWSFRGAEVERTINNDVDLLVMGNEKPTKEFFNRLASDIQAVLDKPRS